MSSPEVEKLSFSATCRKGTAEELPQMWLPCGKDSSQKRQRDAEESLKDRIKL